MKRNVLQESDAGSNHFGSEHEKLVERLLDDPFKQEAVEWLKGGGMDDKRTVGRFETNRDSLKLVQDIYDLGALQIFAVQIQQLPKARGQRTGKLIVKLPTRPG